VEGKTREVAILDYWSQTVLRPLHFMLFNVLRKIPQDCTFNQGSFLDKLPQSDQKFYSVDLTSATDRFPIRLIEAVLKGRLTDDYVHHWHNIMVGLPFDSPLGKVSYSVGNPMGAYSSWNSFAVAHHYVMYYCCRELGINWRKAPYVLLGDDIVIKHNDLAKKYMEVITSLGVEFSLQKTYVSPHSYEFAKRFVADGVEVSPFPIGGLWEVRKSSDYQMALLSEESRKGWEFSLEIPSMLGELYALLRLPSRVIAKRKERMFIAYQLMVGMSGRVTAESALKPILVKHFPAILKILEDGGRDLETVSLNILKSISMIAFSNSAEQTKTSKFQVGSILSQIVTLFELFPSVESGPSDIIDSLPFPSIQKEIMSAHDSLMKEAFEIDTNLSGDWKLKLKALAIPLDERIYYCRNQHLKTLASSKLGGILREQLKLLEQYPQLI